MSLLDEESNFPKGSDATFLQKCHENHEKNTSYVKPRQTKPQFGVRHYAGEVTYQIEGFLEKNRDTLKQDMLDLFKDSKNSLIAKWFELPPDDAAGDSKGGAGGKSGTMKPGKGGKQTVGNQFASSLNDLISTLAACNPFFVRCVKPNPQKVAGKIDRSLVLAQLRYSGMLETIRVRRAGYSGRTKFADFLSRYAIISPDVKKMSDAAAGCKKIMGSVKVPADQWQVGATKVFMKSAVETELEKMRAAKIVVFVYKLQTFFKMATAKSKFRKKKKFIIKIQKVVRGFIGRCRARKWKKGLVRIQAIWRGRKVRIQYHAELEKVRELKRKREEEERKKKEEEERLRKEEEERLAREAEEAKRKALESMDPEEAARIRKEDELLAKLEGTEEERKARAAGRTAAKKKKEFSIPSELKKIMQSHKFSICAPLSAPGYVPFTTYTAPPDFNEARSEVTRKSNNALGASILDLSSNGEDASWPKFARVFFRDGQKPEFQPSAVKDSLLKMSADLSPLSILINRAMLKLVIDDCDPLTAMHCFNYICNKTADMQNSGLPMPKGLAHSDETLCHALRLGFMNPELDSMMRAWKVLAVLLALYPPSKNLAKSLYNHILTEAPNVQMSILCQQRLARAMAKGPRRFGLSSLELMSYFKAVPMVLHAEWIDGQKTAFELDSSTTPEDILATVCRYRGLRQNRGYTFSVLVGETEIPISDFELIMDAVAEAEKKIVEIVPTQEEINATAFGGGTIYGKPSELEAKVAMGSKAKLDKFAGSVDNVSSAVKSSKTLPPPEPPTKSSAPPVPPPGSKPSSSAPLPPPISTKPTSAAPAPPPPQISSKPSVPTPPAAPSAPLPPRTNFCLICAVTYRRSTAGFW